MHTCACKHKNSIGSSPDHGKPKCGTYSHIPDGKKARNAFLARKRCRSPKTPAAGRKVTCISLAWFYYCSRTLPYRSPPPFALLNSRPASTPAAAQIMALRVISAPECCTPNASARERRVAWLIQGGSVLSIQKKTSQLTTRPHADMITSRAFPAIVASLPALGASSGLAFVLLSAARCRWIRRAGASRPTSGNAQGRSRHLRRRNWARRARSRSTIASTASAAPARCSTGASPSCSSLAPRSSRPLAPCTERKSPVSGPSALLSPYRLNIASQCFTRLSCNLAASL